MSIDQSYLCNPSMETHFSGDSRPYQADSENWDIYQHIEWEGQTETALHHQKLQAS